MIRPAHSRSRGRSPRQSHPAEQGVGGKRNKGDDGEKSVHLATAGTGPDADADADTDTDADADTGTGTGTVADTDAGTGTVADTDAGTGPNPAADSVTAPRPRPPASEPASEPVSATATASRATIHTNPKLALASRDASLVLHVAIRIASGPAVIAERDASRCLVLAGRGARVLMLARRDRLWLLARQRPRRPVYSQLLQAHFGVADELRRLIFRLLIKPVAPAAPTLIRGHRWIEVGAVALLVVVGASLGLFKAGSACN